MNNDAIRQFVRKELRAVTIGVATAIGIGGGLPVAIANPLGGAVVGGRGSITSPNATTTLIEQQSNQLTVNWSSFNVASNETVRFVQPSSSSVALNNILSQSPSQIFGRIDANGRVVLINPNGILFGRTAQLNVGSLIASSLELKEYDPATGRLSFQSLGGHPGAIDNEGSISAARGGSVALLGGTVLNNGLVVADYGTVAMGAGQAATLDFYGGGLLRLQVSGDVKSNSAGAKAAVENSGTIQANGGQVLLTAHATQDVFASAVDNSGVVKAARIQNVGGVIHLLGNDGTASDSGTLAASGADAASTGGTVTITGKTASLASTAKIDVSGATGGGSAYIGGGLHGANASVPNASSTTVASGASIDADATDAGKGGTIAVWSNGATTAQGHLSADGGPAGGDGGMIETSGHVLNVTGATVRAAAPAGYAGTWLLDPYDVIIDHGSGTSISGGNNGTNTTVYDADINAALKGNGTGGGTNVTIETSQPAATTPTATGAITFGSGVVITNDDSVAHTLSLDADTSISLSAATGPSITSGTGDLDLVLQANANGQANGTAPAVGSVALDGTINVHTLQVTGTDVISQAGGTITVAGATTMTTGSGKDITLNSTGNTFTGGITLTGDNVNIDGTNTAGSLTVDAAGAVAFGAASTDSTTITGTGALIIQGASGSGAAGGAVSQVGTLVVGGTSSIDAGTNDITLANAGNSFTGALTLTGGAVTLANSVGTTLAGANTATSLTLDAGGAVAFGTASTDSTTITGTGALVIQGASGSGAAGGALSQVGKLVVGGTSSIDAGTNNIALSDASNSFTGALTLTGGAVTLANSVGTTLAGANSASSLTLDAGGAVAFGTASTDSTTITGTGALVIQGASGSGAAGGAVSQVGKLLVGGTSSIDAGTNNIALSNASNSFTGALTLTGGAVTLANSVGTTLAGANSASSLTLDAGGAVAFGTASTDSTTITGTGALVIQGAGGSGAAGGAVSQVGKLVVGGTSSIDAGTNNIALSDASNSFTGALTLTGGAVTLANSVGTTLAGANSASSLTLDAGGAVAFGTASTDSTTITGTGALVVQGVSGSGAAGGAVSQVGKLVVGGTSNINAGANTITLGNSSNSFGGNVAFAGTAVTLASGGALSSSGTASGNLSETAGGTISEGSAGIRLTGAAGTNTATFTVTAAGTDVNLAGSTTNNFNGEATTIQASGAGTVANVSVADTNSTFVPLTLPGTLTSLTLSDPNAAIQLAAATLTGTGTALDVTAGGAITQSGALSLTNGSAVLNASNGTSDINLGSPNTFSGNVAFTGNNVTLLSTGALSSSGVAHGNLSETAGGTISEGAAGIQLAGTAGTNTATFTVTAAGSDVDLAGSTANNFNDEATTIQASGAGTVRSVSVADTNATFVPLTFPSTLTSLTLIDPNASIKIPAETLTGTGTALDVSAGGAITQSGALAVTGGTTLSTSSGAGDITLGNVANAFSGAMTLTGYHVTLANSVGTTLSGTSFIHNNLTLDAGGAVAFGTASTDNTAVLGALLIQGLNGSGAAGGAVTQAGSLTVDGTSSIDAGTNAITLANFNDDFASPVTVTGGAVTLANVGPMVIAGASSASSLTLDTVGMVTFGSASRDSTTVTGNLIVQGVTGAGPTSGPVTQVGTLSVGGTSDINANTSTITLDNPNNIFGGNVGFAGGNVTLASSGALSSSGTASGNLSETAGGTISEGAAGIQLAGAAGTNTATFTVTGAMHDVDLGSAANNFNGEAMTIAASGGGTVGNVRVADTNATFMPLTLPGTIASLVLDDPNAPIALATETLTGAGAGGNLAGGTTTLDVTAGGAVTQTGALVVDGTTAIDANGGADDITLGQANTFAGNVAFTGRNVTLTTGSGDLSSSGTAGGTLTETSAGAITQGGRLTVTGASSLTANAGAGDITLGQANIFGGTVAFSGHDVTLITGTGGLSSAGTAGGTLTETSAGAITQGGVLSVTGGSTLTASGGAGDITLAQANTFGGDVAFSGHDVTLGTGTGDLMSSGSASGNLTETSAAAITQGGALSVTGGSTLTANNGAGAITLANEANAFGGSVTLSGGAVVLANAGATTLARASGATSLTLDAGGAVTFGAVSTDHTTVTNDLIVQGLAGSGAAGGAVGEIGTLSVGGTTSIDAGGNAINLGQANTFGGDVAFAGSNVALTAGAGNLTASGTASGNLTEIAKGPSSDLNVGVLSAGGNVLLIAGDSILGTSSQATVTANNVEVRYGLENSNGQFGSANASQQIGFVATSTSRVQLTLWLPAPGTQFQTKDLRQTQSDLLITSHPFVPGEQAILYTAPFGVSPGQVAGTLNAIQTTVQGTSTQTAGVAQGAATQGTQSVLYIDWGSYNPNVSLFGTLNPAVCLPADQREEGVGSASGCAAASASLLEPPAPIRVAMVPTREGWKSMPLFYLEQ